MSIQAEEKTYAEKLEVVLEQIENNINAEAEDKLINDWINFLEDKCTDSVFVPKRENDIKIDCVIPEVTVNEALKDYDAMLLQQYANPLSTLNSPVGRIMCIRANYGCPILATAFGAEVIYMDDKHNCLPGNTHFSKDKIKELIKAEIPDFDNPYTKRVFHTGRQLFEIAEKYPKIGKYVKIIHPDLQGPIDICEVLWGSNLFYDLYDDSDMVKEFLAIITDTYIKFIKEWQKIVKPEPVYNAHWGFLHKGQIALRNDSVMNLSPEMYEEFVFPCDSKIFAEFGGGVVHYCGRGDHYTDQLAKLPGICAVQLSQPHYNDMEKIYQQTIDTGVKLIMFSEETARESLTSGRDLKGQVQSFAGAPFPMVGNNI
ncbi:MAG: hypothetical protein ACYTFY_05415 [Planctomycetota bacterium]|jgi:hypothetical protein